MKLTFLTIAVLAICLQDLANGDELFFRGNEYETGHQRIRRQTNADQMVQNILQWLQGVYTQNSRKIRQGTLREYLPPSNTQRPRPFEPNSIIPTQRPTYQGYPPAGSITPQPPFPIYTNPTTGAVTGEGYPSPNNDIHPPFPGSSSQPPPYNPPVGPGLSTDRPGFPTNPPAGYPTSERPGFSTNPPQGYPTSERPGFPTNPPTGYPTGRPSSDRPGFPTNPPSGYPTSNPTQDYTTTQPPVTSAPITTTTQEPGPSTHVPITSNPSTYYTSPAVTTEAGENPPSPPAEDNSVVPGSKQEPSDDNAAVTSPPSSPASEEDAKHPPHIHAIDVECAKDMMTITIEFNREFNGVIYSKGHYSTPECRYVNENSEQTKYKFTVNLNSCGTEFINAFDTQNQSYLENILVIQNEVGIQEVWDTVRSVRCLWEGNLKDSLSVALSVGMLNQEIVTFSGDTAMAKLDIQVGKGPFAPPANGLVKIGEPMSLVISVTGDPGFDIQVKDCRATDSNEDNVYPLTDENGCVLKPKLFGAFQKTRNTGSTGASIIAFAFFNAFKFPDVMDLMIQCNIELCKTDCQVCPDGNQKIEPGRRRKRDVGYYRNQTGDGVTMGKNLRVVLPADLSEIEEEIININHVDGICMSTQSFVLSSVLLISVLTASCLMSAALWLKQQQRIFNKV